MYSNIIAFGSKLITQLISENFAFSKNINFQHFCCPLQLCGKLGHLEFLFFFVEFCFCCSYNFFFITRFFSCSPNYFSIHFCLTKQNVVMTGIVSINVFFLRFPLPSSGCSACFSCISKVCAVCDGHRNVCYGLNTP